MRHKPYQWKVLPLRLATAPGIFTSLTKPILFLFKYKGFHVKIYLDDILVLTHSKHADKRAWIPLCSWLAYLGLVNNFSSSELHLTWHFICGHYVGIQWTCQCLCHLKNFLRYTSWFIHHYKDNLFDSIRLCPFGQDQLLCQWTCMTLPVVLCHLECMLIVFHSPAHLFFLFTFLTQHRSIVQSLSL